MSIPAEQAIVKFGVQELNQAATCLSEFTSIPLTSVPLSNKQ
jgi:hypothetical protein